ncbi:MAG: biotin/lipoyl-binding protein, partial [Thermodesulfobacteriota bacterium]
MSAGSKLLKVSIPILILIAGFAGMKWLKLSRQPPQKEVKIISGALVETLTVKAEDHDVMVLGTGTVQARQQAAITPQVSGKVSYLAPDFVAGGFFKKGDLLFEIESVDYQLAIERTKATLSKAEYNLSTVESQARVARMEWDRLKLEGEKKPNPLVLYEPQLKNAQAEVASAKATLKQATLDMERTHVYAPFDCR